MLGTEFEINKRKAQDLFRECSPVFIALGDSVRQKLILEIADSDNDGVNVKYLAEKTSLSRTAILYHLKFLIKSGLVRTEKKNSQVYYYLGIEEKINMVSSLIVLLKSIIGENEAKRR